jgi:hypothetical protein
VSFKANDTGTGQDGWHTIRTPTSRYWASLNDIRYLGAAPSTDRGVILNVAAELARKAHAVDDEQLAEWMQAQARRLVGALAEK